MNFNDLSKAVTWACLFFKLQGFTLHVVSKNTWDLETPNGWIAINSALELVSVANKLNQERSK